MDYTYSGKFVPLNCFSLILFGERSKQAPQVSEFYGALDAFGATRSAWTGAPWKSRVITDG